MSPRPTSSKPTISVILPVFNLADYAGRALQSLCQQSFGDFEVLAVDDGSTDDSLEVLHDFAQKDPRIRVIEQANSGVYKARNVGLASAQGEFICFVDPDDVVHQDLLLELFDVVTRSAADIAFCDVAALTLTGAVKPRLDTKQFPGLVGLTLESHPELIATGFTAVWSKLFRRQLIDAHKLLFRDDYPFSADMIFSQHALIAARKIARVPRTLYFYQNSRPGSLTRHSVRSRHSNVTAHVSGDILSAWADAGKLDVYAPYIVKLLLKNLLGNSHLEEAKLRALFFEFQRLFTRFKLNRRQLNRLPASQHKILQLISEGKYVRFLHAIRRERRKAVASKGGALTLPERGLAYIEAAPKKLPRAVSEISPIDIHGLHSSADYCRRAITASCRGVGRDSLPKPLAHLAPGLYRRTWQGLQLAKFDAALNRSLRHAKSSPTMRVLHICKWFSRGSETFIYDLITGLEKGTGVDNHVLCFERALIRERPFSKVVKLPNRGFAQVEDGIDRYIAFTLKLAIKRLTPTLIHCHFGWVGVPILRFLEFLDIRIPVIITMHGTDVNTWPHIRPKYTEDLKRFAKRERVSLTTHSNTYKSRLVQLGVPHDKVTIIPNAFSPNFKPKRVGSRHGLIFRILTVARFDRCKGHHYLLEGFARFHAWLEANGAALQNDSPHRKIKVELSLAGDGPLKGEVEGLAHDLGIEDKVNFLDRVPHRWIADLMANHDVLVQASFRHPETLQEEGQPVSILEAIACGLPVIVTDTGAVAESVRMGPSTGSAHVIPPCSPEAIDESLRQVLTGRHRAAPEYIEHIRRHYSLERQLMAYHGLYLSRTATSWREAGITASRKSALLGWA